MSEPIKVLAWSDSVLAATGFGAVSRHVLRELHQTGRYHIDQLAVNYHGEFYDAKKYPYQLSPAKLLDPSDPYGNVQLLKALERGDYDLVWILNDTDVVDGIVPALAKLKAMKKSRGAKVFKIIYYYPVDCAVVPEVSRMIEFADVAVTYTQWAKRQTLKAFPHIGDKVQVIYHGCDVETFHPINRKAGRIRGSDPLSPW